MNKKGNELVKWMIISGLIALLIWMIVLLFRVDAADHFCYPYIREGAPHKVTIFDDSYSTISYYNYYVIKCGDGLHNATYEWSDCARKNKYGFCKQGMMFKENNYYVFT